MDTFFCIFQCVVSKASTTWSKSFHNFFQYSDEDVFVIVSCSRFMMRTFLSSSHAQDSWWYFPCLHDQFYYVTVLIMLCYLIGHIISSILSRCWWTSLFWLEKFGYQYLIDIFASVCRKVPMSQRKWNWLSFCYHIIDTFCAMYLWADSAKYLWWLSFCYHIIDTFCAMYLWADSAKYLWAKGNKIGYRFVIVSLIPFVPCTSEPIVPSTYEPKEIN